MLMRAATTFYFNKFDANGRTTDIYLWDAMDFCHANKNEKTAFSASRRMIVTNRISLAITSTMSRRKFSQECINLTNLATKRTVWSRIISHDSCCDAPSYVTPARFVESHETDPRRECETGDNKVITNNSFTHDACDSRWRVHNRWSRFPIATKVTARALSSAAAHVRTNVKSRADDARDIKHANIIRANMYVAGILSFGVGLFLRRDATRRRYRKCLEGWDRSIPLETRRPKRDDDAAVRSYVNYATTRNCIAMIQRRSPSKYFARDVYLVHI